MDQLLYNQKKEKKDVEKKIWGMTLCGDEHEKFNSEEMPCI